ncbi:kinesin-like protein KIN-UA isoform X2 [Cynara cardunculus var. scolymus]|uniref:kinesin-like protein KIN-UA isoform X2 n=1 Tax=Cynara cardunculus var. scolymus TaxID=59895 RepID=UPI000D631312|nr:kinesin-like protein KIN-UA isoform X2 [Cynara cardunculus var. scolymus]
MANNHSYKNGGLKTKSISSSSSSSSYSGYKSKQSVTSGVRRNSTGSSGNSAGGHQKDTPGVSGRVRVAVRLRPRNSEEQSTDADFADCVELQPELKRLKLRRNNWDSDTFEFDEVLTEFASQKRVYEVVAKPVVESVLDGYNGTVMAYGQTGTGKTYTLGRLGDEDTSARGIMVRAMEDIFAEISPETDLISVSYLQLYMETIQDLLDPTNDNLSITEDPKSGDISLPGASLIEVRDQPSFVELLRLGEAHRFAANTKLNTESSRSHAILMVHVKKSVKERDVGASSGEHGSKSHMSRTMKPPVVRKGKLIVVDLAGSERIDKSGSEGHTLEEAKSINLSLSALGKCINALAENSSHVPVRDSKLTRLLRDSFGGTARTSLVITIGPSPRHRGETSSTIMFGQRAMKVENMLKIKEEFDYKSLARKLDVQVESLIAEHERQQKAYQDEVEKIGLEAKKQISEAEKLYADTLEKERLKYQRDCTESIKKLEAQLAVNQEKQGDGRVKVGFKDESFHKKSNGEAQGASASAELIEVKKLLQNEILLRKAADEEIGNLRNQVMQWKRSEAAGSAENLKLRKMLEDEIHQREKLEEEISMLQNQLLQISFDADETRKQLESGHSIDMTGEMGSLISPVRQQQMKYSGEQEKGSVAKLFEQVGLQKILSLLEAEDPDVRIHAVKVIANLAAEATNQEKIVEAGGLTSLLALLTSSEDENIHRVAAGAIANLAMNETNQELIMAQGGISLLAMTAENADDPQTLRMVAGAVANLCGNDKLQVMLRAEGGIRALLGMVRCRHPDVLAQVARGIANFAKCESRASTQGIKSGKSHLIEDGALPWIVKNANNEASPIRRHIELALCHMAQHVNAKEMISGGALWELVRISRDCSRDDIRILARRTLSSSPTFQVELKRLRLN